MSKQQCSYCRSVDYPHAESKKIRLGQLDIPLRFQFFFNGVKTIKVGYNVSRARLLH